MNHCLVLDIGKTHKKALVFDEHYQVVLEQSTRLPESVDDDGFPCEDLALLETWIRDTVATLRSNPRFTIRAMNVTAYGASFVHVNEHEQPVGYLYNYLKPYPEDLLHWLEETYGPLPKLSLETASPLLGHLNSGLQLLWLKHRKPELFRQIRRSWHLPEWAFRVGATGFLPDTNPDPITSLGCHTMLWDFQQNDFHPWMKAEGLTAYLAAPERQALSFGLHDSSAALIPYLTTFEEPFMLLSTGTWCIALNPFNQEPLTEEELQLDCLCYLSWTGIPVKAARYFGGNEHENGVKAIAAALGLPEHFYQNTEPGPAEAMVQYSTLMEGIIQKQIASLKLALGQSPVRRIFVDGGFAHNERYMRGLAAAFPDLEVYAAEVAQATALGAALAIHDAWNTHPVPSELIDLKSYLP
jgi:sugar (pentulose or hexulose) kinase